LIVQASWPRSCPADPLWILPHAVTQFDGGLLVLIRSDDEKIVSASFLAKDKEKITHIAHGTTITVRGELEKINSYSINVRNCEIV
jgi:hypothetical protein